MLNYVLTILMFLSLGSPAFAEDATPVLAFGDLRGYFEPCGCDPKTDLGGMSRLSGLLAREKRSHPDALVVSLGNNLEASKPDIVKERAIIDAMKFLKLDAVLFNRVEIERIFF